MTSLGIPTRALPMLVDVVAYAAGTQDAHGNAASTESGRQTGIPARIWQLGTREEILNRQATEGTWKALLPSDVTIAPTSRVEWAGKVFDVAGAPALVYGARAAHHVEVELTYREAAQ